MQSTGEVIGLAADARVAMAKALVAASLHPPVPGPGGALALLSIADRDKWALGALAAGLAAVGYRFCATAGTAEALRALGYDAEVLARVGEASAGRTVLEAIGSGEVQLVVNSPSPGAGPVRDAGQIRMAALAEGIICLTAIDTALAAVEALDPNVTRQIDDLRSLGEWLDQPAPALT
jgi:carbamoyl-phosphate synthase large subunit